MTAAALAAVSGAAAVANTAVIFLGALCAGVVAATAFYSRRWDREARR